MGDIVQMLEQQAAAAVEAFPALSLSIAYINGSDVSTIHTAGSLIDPPDDTSEYPIGSISKTFTGTLLAGALLFTDLELHTPVKDIIPELAGTAFPEGIHLLSLATHSSGLPRIPPNVHTDELEDLVQPYARYSEQDLLDFLSTYTTPPPPPGPDAFLYSNLGGGLLGYCLERATGKTYEQLLAEALTGPHALAMPHTRCSLHPQDNPNLVQGYVLKEDVHGPPSLLKKMNLTSLGDFYALPAWTWEGVPIRAAGCLTANLQDMVTYAKAAISAAHAGSFEQIRQGPHQDSNVLKREFTKGSKVPPEELLRDAERLQMIRGPRIPFPMRPPFPLQPFTERIFTTARQYAYNAAASVYNTASSLWNRGTRQAEVHLQAQSTQGQPAGGIGLHWLLEDWSDTTSGSGLVWHNGATYTSNSALIVNPDLNVGVVLLANFLGTAGTYSRGPFEPQQIAFAAASSWYCGAAGGDC